MNDSLAHYGVLGMKWGIRRYQNDDGSLNELGKARKKKYETSADKYKKGAEEYKERANAARARIPSYKNELSRYEKRNGIISKYKAKKLSKTISKSEHTAMSFYQKYADLVDKHYAQIHAGERFMKRIEKSQNRMLKKKEGR